MGLIQDKPLERGLDRRGVAQARDATALTMCIEEIADTRVRDGWRRVREDQARLIRRMCRAKGPACRAAP
jgi:hypothetical protein